MQEDGEGIAVCKVEHKATGKPLFALITYVYPTLSARAVPQLKDFCETYRAWMQLSSSGGGLASYLSRLLFRVRAVANLA